MEFQEIIRSVTVLLPLSMAGTTLIKGTCSSSAGPSTSPGYGARAFNHDFSKMLQNCENDRLAIIRYGRGAGSSDRPMVLTSGVGLGAKSPGDIATEDFFNSETPHPRKAPEIAGQAAAKQGAKVIVVRLPQGA